MMMMVTFWAWSPCTRWCTGWGKGRWHSRQGSGHMASWWNETQIDTNKFQNFSLSPYPREDLICFTHFETEKTAFWSPNGTGVSLVNTISLKAFMKRKELHEDSVPSYSNLVLTRPWRVGLFDFGSGLTKKFGFGYCAYYGLKANSCVFILCNSISCKGTELTNEGFVSDNVEKELK